MKKMIAFLLAVGLLLSGCGPKSQAAVDLMADIEPIEMLAGEEGPPSAAVTDFSLRLFQTAMEEGENTLISPLSVLYALGMTANGAKGNTLSQMETVLGDTVGPLNGWLGTYETGENLHLANGIWFRDDPRFTVNQDFLQINANFYGAGIYKAPFDGKTLKEINGFVEEHTEGMIQNVLDEIPDGAVMYLVNALSFEDRWQEAYRENQVHEGLFTTEDGRQQKTELMWSEEYCYLQDDRASGFLKYYENDRFAFMALLPKKGLTVSEYVKALTGAHLQELLENPVYGAVDVAIPKFETEYDMEMKDTLTSMGMTDAFDPELADFSGLGTSEDGNISISRVLHKTYISVAEQGTRAGAATVVEATDAAAAMPEEIKEVILDRPFLYMILDLESNTPVFMGTLMDLGAEGFLFVEPNENGHVHLPAEEPALCSDPVSGYCGNMQTTVHLNGADYTFAYDDSVTLTDILINLNYSPDLICRCMAEFTVDTEPMGGFEVNLTESFARCKQGQAPLTAEQIQTIRDIIDRL